LIGSRRQAEEFHLNLNKQAAGKTPIVFILSKAKDLLLFVFNE
jgi:hypothetical protein